LETDAPPPLEEVVPLAELIGEVRDEALALSNGRHSVEVEAASAPNIRGSSRELHSALVNLASNAVRYTPEGGRVSLNWRDLPNGGGEFCVSDTGIGIAMEHIGRLTERFYRVDRGRSRDVGGTGLGLAIVKHVLERHGGSLRISSEPGKGSTFCASFPAARIVR
jgi:two-component system phosphate regulon sensor histidine kinase PhoR